MTDHLTQMLVEATLREIAWKFGCSMLIGVCIGVTAMWYFVG